MDRVISLFTSEREYEYRSLCIFYIKLGFLSGQQRKLKNSLGNWPSLLLLDGKRGANLGGLE